MVNSPDASTVAPTGLSFKVIVMSLSLTGCPFKRSLAVRSPTIPPLAPLTILSEKSSATAEIEAASTVTSTDDDEQFAGFSFSHTVLVILYSPAVRSKDHWRSNHRQYHPGSH